MLGPSAQQPSPRDGGERDRDLQLGIILPAGPLKAVGPAMIEDIFALAVSLEIGWCGSDRSPLLLDEDRHGSPARRIADAPRVFEQAEKGMGQERVALPRQRS